LLPSFPPSITTLKGRLQRESNGFDELLPTVQDVYHEHRCFYDFVNDDEVVKTSKLLAAVIPAKAGIQ
jgi:hypothetical protein